MMRPTHRHSASSNGNDLEVEAKIREELDKKGGKPAPSLRHGEAAAASTTVSDAKASSFEDAQVIGEQLAEILTTSCSAGEAMPAEATELLRALVSSTSGARGWFVTLLTNPDYDAVFEPPLDASFLDALCASPDPNVRLMTMNVAMSTATELAHAANGNADLAAGSALTKRRATVLVSELLKEKGSDRLPGLREAVAALLQAVSMDEAAFEADRGRAGKKGGAETAVDEWVTFCKKWGYGAAQRDAIRKQLEGLL